MMLWQPSGGSEMTKSRVPHPDLFPLLEAHGISLELFWKRGPAGPEIRAKRRAIVTELHGRGLTHPQIAEISGLATPARFSDLVGTSRARENQRRVGRTIGRKNLEKGQQPSPRISPEKHAEEATTYGFLADRQMLGVLCKHGHEVANTGRSLRWKKAKGYPGDCVQCRAKDRKQRYAATSEDSKAGARAWYLANRERAHLAQKKYYEGHRGKILEYQIRYRKENQEKVRASKADHYQRNALRLKAKQRARYYGNHAKELARRAMWRLQNPEKLRAHQKAWSTSERGKEATRRVQTRRRLRIHGSLGQVSLEHKRNLLIKCCGKCPACSKTFVSPRARCGASPSWDHMLPLVRGGLDDDSNLIPLCRSCNSRKGRKTLEEWLGIAKGLLLRLKLGEDLHVSL